MGGQRLRPALIYYPDITFHWLQDRRTAALKKEDVHIDERWFFIREAKTKSGIKKVPIAEKIVPFFEQWLTTIRNI